ncbi:FecR domain-containing protein [Methylobacillus arboreus]|uniref:FecR domain-containing protein n=1 Tax=Methylobacillus arboreus TaxID=755170 RepID=UPI001E51B04A|nr:FecR domain-containing protein [Methylobacillus arboreus]MCB5189476.1 FecR domain-containing protein [Methylobacillus arboreus]
MAAPELSIRQTAMQAAEWFVLIDSGEATAQDLTAFEQWRQASLAHEQAWQQAQRISGLASGLPEQTGATLRRKVRLDRRKAIKQLAWLIAVLPACWLGWHTVEQQGWLADYHTATGEQRRLILADGTVIQLNTATRVNVDYNNASRTVHLLGGEILIETAHDPDAHLHGKSRPFILQTAYGQIQPLGTRFVVRHIDGHVFVAVEAGAVQVNNGRYAEIIDAGMQTRFDAESIALPQALAARELHWSRGVISADDTPLADFIAELSRYRPGILRCDPAVADIRVTGAYQLQDTDAILLNLAKVFPVKLEYRTRYWVTVAAR